MSENTQEASRKHTEKQLIRINLGNVNTGVTTRRGLRNMNYDGNLNIIEMSADKLMNLNLNIKIY